MCDYPPTGKRDRPRMALSESLDNDSMKTFLACALAFFPFSYSSLLLPLPPPLLRGVIPFPYYTRHNGNRYAFTVQLIKR